MLKVSSPSIHSSSQAYRLQNLPRPSKTFTSDLIAHAETQPPAYINPAPLPPPRPFFALWESSINAVCFLYSTEELVHRTKFWTLRGGCTASCCVVAATVSPVLHCFGSMQTCFLEAGFIAVLGLSGPSKKSFAFVLKLTYATSARPPSSVSASPRPPFLFMV